MEQHTAQERIDLLQKVGKEGVDTPIPLIIKPSSTYGGGLGMFTTANIKAGVEVLRVELPKFKISDKDACDSCLHHLYSSLNKSGELSDATFKLTRCSGCKHVSYCSQECQKQAWTHHHKAECKKLRKLTDIQLSEPLHMVLRILCMRKAGQISDEMWKVLLLLQGPEIGTQPAITPYTNEVMQIHAALNSAFPIHLIMGLLSRASLNTHGMMTAEGIKTGMILIPFGSIVNHSCDPNTFFFADGTTFFMRSSTEIPKGGEITICYIPMRFFLLFRQEQLFAHYRFHCICSRCEKEKDEMRKQAIPRVEDMQDTVEAGNEMADIFRSIFAEISASFEEKLEKLYLNTSKVAKRVASGKEWPEYLDPLQAIHMELIEFARIGGNIVESFRNALRVAFIYEPIVFVLPVDLLSTINQLKLVMTLNVIIMHLQKIPLPPALQSLKPLEKKLVFMRRLRHEMLIESGRKAWGPQCSYTVAMETLYYRQVGETYDEYFQRTGGVDSKVNNDRAMLLKLTEAEVLKWADLPARSGLITGKI